MNSDKWRVTSDKQDNCLLVTRQSSLFNALWKTGFGLFRVRSPLLAESLLFSLPPGTEMVHFPGLARTRLCIQRAVSGFFPEGFPHSDIPGSKGASPSPRLIAGSHVLHRRLAPRHPPYALSSLTIIICSTHQEQFTALSLQFTAKRPRIKALTVDCRLSTVNCLFADSPFLHCPDPIPDSLQPPTQPPAPVRAFPLGMRI